MDLAELTGQPTLVDVAGKSFGFSELTLGLLGELQAWIKANTPHPLDSLKAHLNGFTPEQQGVLLDQARRDAMYWPPKVGSTMAVETIFESREGKTFLIHLGLKVHKPDAPLSEAEWIYRKIRQDAEKAKLIFALILTGEPPEDDKSPKGEGGATATATPSLSS